MRLPMRPSRRIGILASLAHGFWVNPKHLHVEGIRGLTRLDIQFAGQLGYTIKLLGIVKRPEPIADCQLPIANLRPAAAASPIRNRKLAIGNRQSSIQVSVYPTLVPNAHVLASVSDVFNAILV